MRIVSICKEIYPCWLIFMMTMANGLFDCPYKDTIVYFDMFFRKVPENGGFAIMAGLEQLIEYINGINLPGRH